MQTVLHKADTRGYAKESWLATHHSFSFASYFNPERMGFGLLRVLNDDTIAAGKGFGRHPHDNMEIITIPLSGALSHEDNMGNAATVKAGEVQVMSAGTGVEHSEFNASKTEEVNLLQLWIETRTRGIAPRYAEQLFAPSFFENKFSLVVGPEGSETTGALSIHQDAFLSLGYFSTGETAEYILHDKKTHGVYVFVIEGQIMAENVALVSRDALGVWETEKIAFKMRSDAKILLVEVPMEA